MKLFLMLYKVSISIKLSVQIILHVLQVKKVFLVTVSEFLCEGMLFKNIV